jgi:hypothetical protein
MADEQSPTVEIAPTIIISNSDEGGENDLDSTSGEIAGEPSSENSTVIAEASDTDGLSSSDSEVSTDDKPSNVAIAEIEAGRDIALAEIHSEVERERIEHEHGELDECRKEIADLRAKVEQMEILLTPPLQSEEQVIAEQSAIVPEQNLTEPSIAAPTLETMTEPLDESAEENPVVVEEAVHVRKYIAI